MNRLIAMMKARLLEVLRDRMALGWNLVFAPLLVVGMAATFSGTAPAVLSVGVLGDQPMTPETNIFFATEATKFHVEPELDKGVVKVQRQSLDMLFDPSTTPVRYWINPESAKGRLLQSVLRAQQPEAALQAVNGAQIRYSDWLVPGLLGVNIMFSSLLAIGHVIVRYRKSGYLKRLNGTPLLAMEFIAAQMLACLIIVVAVSAFIFTACSLLLHLRMEGSYLTLLLIATLGSMSMIALSLLICARISSEELSGALLNLISWPMLVLSGVFFSLDGAPAVIRATAELFPLTHMLDAARRVMLDGAGLVELTRPILILSAMTAVFLVLGSRFFRWTQD